MNLTDIVTEYGAYYRKQGQNMNKLYQLLRRKLESEAIFTTQITDETIWEGARVLYTRLVQSYQTQFTPIGTLKFEPVKIQMFHIKVDSQETPHTLESTWLGFLADNNVTPVEWPFVKWWIEKQVIPQIQQDMELLEIGKGVRTEPVNGTAGAAGASMDGFLTIIKKNVTAGRTIPISMGALPTGANADKLTVDYFEDFGDQISKEYWKLPMELNCSEDVERSFNRGLLEKYGKNYVMNEQNNGVKFTKLTVAGRGSMMGSNRIFCTPKDNAVALKKKTENMNRFDVQAFERVVKILTDWWFGVGFILPELVFANDQE